jgi:hypothetical protein
VDGQPALVYRGEFTLVRGGIYHGPLHYGVDYPQGGNRIKNPRQFASGSL